MRGLPKGGLGGGGLGGEGEGGGLGGGRLAGSMRVVPGTPAVPKYIGQPAPSDSSGT